MGFKFGLSNLPLSPWAAVLAVGLGIVVLLVLCLLLAFGGQRIYSRRPAGKSISTLAARVVWRLLPIFIVAAILCMAAAYIAFASGGVVSTNGIILLAALALIFVIAVILAGLFIADELRCLGWLADAAAGLARNQLDVHAPPDISRRRDEVGRMTQALQSIAVNLGVGVDEIARLVEVSQSVSARAPLAQTLGVLLRSVLRGVDARAAGVYLVESDALRAVANEGDLLLSAAVEGTIEHYSRQVWRTATFVSLSQLGNANEINREALAQSDVRALAVFPMLREGRTTGTLWVVWDESRDVSPMDRNFLAALANLAGIVVDSNQSYHSSVFQDLCLGYILQNNREGILIADWDGRLLLANPIAESLLNFSASSRMGVPIQTVLNHEQVYMMIADLLRDRGPAVVEIERNGRRLHISAARLRVPEQNSVTRGWVFLLRDETEAHRSDTAQHGIVGMLSHSMRTPSACVRGYASLLSASGGQNTDQQEEYIHRIIKGIDDITQILNEYQDMSNIVSGRDLTRTPCQIVTLAIKVADAMSTYIEAKGLTLQTEFARDVPRIVGDAGRLEHAIRNLVDNAMKYTNAPGWIKLSVQESPSHVLIHVADSGIGIPRSYLHRIFEPGLRVKTPATAHISGTGNGLAIVKRIVEQHGGQVWVESQLGVGSTFHISLPKDRSLAEMLGEEPPANNSPAPTPDMLQPANERAKRGRDADSYL